MAIKQYESVVVINAALDDDHINGIIKTISSLITENSGKIIDLNIWGRKRLAYPINKSKSGYYAVYRFTAPAELIAKLERMYRLDENVIRYLTILLDKKALAHYAKLDAEKNETAKANEVTAEKNTTDKIVKDEVVEKETTEEKTIQEKTSNETEN